jgi:hypothetical protein
MMIINMALKFILTDEVKERVVDKINEKIDIPFLDEEMEEELLNLL